MSEAEVTPTHGHPASAAWPARPAPKEQEGKR